MSSKPHAAAPPRGARDGAPMFARAAAIAAGSADPDRRTVDLVFSTGAKVRRYSWRNDEAYDEELALTPGAVRLDRLNGGAPFLAAHSQGLDDILGVVEPGSAKVGGGEGRATVRFSKRDEVEPVFQDIKDEIITAVSVGYRVHKFERTAPLKEGDVAVYRAVDWEPFEISAVAMGADAGAGFRSETSEKNPCEIVEIRAAVAHSEGVHMIEEEKKAAAALARRNEIATIARLAQLGDAWGEAQIATALAVDAVRELAYVEVGKRAAPAATAGTTTAASVEAERIRAEAVLAERTRGDEIRAIAKVAKLGEEWITARIADGSKAGAARKLAFAELAKRSEEGGETRGHVVVLADAGDKFRDLVANAVMHRGDPSIKLEEGAREFRGMTMMELGRDLLDRRKIATRGLGRMELATRILGLDGTRAGGQEGTSDFASILANVMNKTLRRQYDVTARTFADWARPSQNPDFKTITRTVLSGAPSLLAVNEGGEYKRGAVTDGKETYQLATYGRVVAFTRPALINDDLSALSRLPMLMGRAAADLESDTVYAVLTANPNMSDGNALFSVAHANLDGVAATINIGPLGKGRAGLRKQVGLEGRPINAVPKYLVVPATQEAVALQYTSLVYEAASAGATNPFGPGGQTSVKPIVEPRLDVASTLTWYLMADPAQIDTVEYCYLEGNEGVYTETKVGFDVDGIELKVRHDFAAKALDWRGMWQNPGA